MSNMFWYEQLFSQHHISDVTDQTTQNSINTLCDIHNKEYLYYCKTCKLCLCNACVDDKEIIGSHKEHVVESYKNIISLMNKLINYNLVIMKILLNIWIKWRKSLIMFLMKIWIKLFKV